MLWTIVPLLRTVTVPAVATFDTDRSMANSDRSASIGSPAATASPSPSRIASPTAMMLANAVTSPRASTTIVQVSRLSR